MDGFVRAIGGIQWEYLIRIVVACFCGGAVGFERSRRLKDAGVRTHVIVALGAALAVIVSKYGFLDVAAFDNIRADASRIASNVVTGVSFLGAGVIFVKGASIKGLTTAAGIWSTASIGLALGCGMYFIGIAATVLMVVIQFVLHKVFKNIDGASVSEISVTLGDSPSAMADFRTQLEKRKMTIQNCKIVKNIEEESISVKASVRVPNELGFDDIVSMMQDNPQIKSFDM